MADKVIRIKDLRPQDVRGDRYTLHRGNVLDAYPDWEAPDLIVSDGAYGVRGFRGDTVSADGLVDWYAPHVYFVKLRWTCSALNLDTVGVQLEHRRRLVPCFVVCLVYFMRECLFR